MTSSLINRVLKQAMVTFSQCKSRGTANVIGDQKFVLGLAEVKRLTSSITSEDVYFEPTLVLESGGKTPVTYISVIENQTVTIGVFVLRNEGYTMPLHDHPSMYGFIKVIFGRIRVRSYSEIKDNASAKTVGISDKRRIVKVEMLEEFEASQNSPAAMLTPKEGNFHSITSIGGPAAFLDLLSPPYDYRTGQRICRYYSEMEPSEVIPHGDGDKLSTSYRFLIEIDEPDDFQCDSFEYRGPKLSFSSKPSLCCSSE